MRYQLAVGGVKGTQDYATVVDIVDNQLGKSAPHRYDSKEGVILFTLDVDIDLHPIEEAGFDFNVRKLGK